MTENKQHPHAEFLRAMADGEPVQVSVNGVPMYEISVRKLEGAP